MSEENDNILEDITDTQEMMGQGYDSPSIEIYAQQSVIRRKGREMQEEIIPAFIKISTSFKSELKDISGTAMKIWIFIALSINRNTEQAHPGIRTIADSCGMSQNTALTAIKELEGLGLLSVTRGERRYNIYQIPDYVSANAKNASKIDAVAETASIKSETASVNVSNASVDRGITRGTRVNHIKHGANAPSASQKPPTRRTDAKVRGDLMDGILAFGAQGQALAEQTGIEAGIAQAILDYPVDVRSGVQMMYTHFGIRAIPEKPRSGRGGDYADWIAGVRDLQKISAAYKVDFSHALEVTRKAWNESPFSVARPAALKKTMSSTLARLSAPSTESDQPQTWQQETWRNSVY